MATVTKAISEYPEGSDFWTLFRPTGPSGNVLYQGDVASWQLNVFRLADTVAESTPLYTAGCTASSATAHDTEADAFNEDAHAALFTSGEGLQVDGYWNVDGIGYTFRHRLKSAKFFQEGASSYLLEYVLTTTAGYDWFGNHQVSTCALRGS